MKEIEELLIQAMITSSLCSKHNSYNNPQTVATFIYFLETLTTKKKKKKSQKKSWISNPTWNVVHGSQAVADDNEVPLTNNDRLRLS